jgi:hypothetical protein
LPGKPRKICSGPEIAVTVLVEQKPSAATVGKLRRLRRNRRFLGITYWAAWVIAGVVFLLVLAGAMAGLAAS